MPKGIYRKSNNGTASKDHLGNEFASVNAMCRHYGLPSSTFGNRMLRGWTLEQALTVKAEGQGSKIKPKKQMWKDHLGNEYISLPEMCAAWGITAKVYQGRRRNLKWPLEKTLTTPLQKQPGNSKRSKDHLGNEFASVSEMCRHHGIKLSMFKERVKAGWDIERALTAPAKDINDMAPKRCKDHLGREYASKNEMCRAYGISRYTLQSRLDRGWDIERALTEGKNIHRVEIKDHEGRTFPTLKDMANFYGLSEHRLQGIGLDRESMLGELPKLVSNAFRNLDLGNGTRIIKCLQWPYFLADIDGRECVMHAERVLDIYHGSDMFDPLPPTGVKPFIEIKRRLGFPYYLAAVGGKESVLSYWNIININAENNFGLGYGTNKK